MSDSLRPHGLQHARLPRGVLKTKFIKSEQIDGDQRQGVGGRMGEGTHEVQNSVIRQLSSRV